MTEQVNIRMSTADRLMVQEAADRRRLSLSAYIRMVAVTAAETEAVNA